MVTHTSFTKQHNPIGRVIAFVYGLTSYGIFFATFLYLCGFISNVLVPRSIDSAPIVPLGSALLVNLALIALFGLQHSGMARKGFKQWWTQFVPQAVERSTYVLFSSLCLMVMMYFWQPMGGVVWQVSNSAIVVVLYAITALGWLTVLASTFLINHFDLFGLNQVWCYLRGKEHGEIKFVTPALYQYVRHPLYVGFLLALWATPSMTVAHLVLASALTVYILMGVRLEEKDLVTTYGELYKAYRRQVPMLIPFTKRSGRH